MHSFLHCYYKDIYGSRSIERELRKTVVWLSCELDRPPSRDAVDRFLTDLDWDCPVCAAPLTATYEDQWLRISCTECHGLFGDKTRMVRFSSRTIRLQDWRIGLSKKHSQLDSIDVCWTSHT